VRRRCWSGLKRVATRVTGEVLATGARVCKRRPAAKRDTLVCVRPAATMHANAEQPIAHEGGPKQRRGDIRLLRGREMTAAKPSSSAWAEQR